LTDKIKANDKQSIFVKVITTKKNKTMITNYPSLKFYIPTNLDLDNINGYKEKHKEKYLWFIHSILYKSLVTKNDFNGYVNLNKELLVKYIGQNFYNKIKLALIDAGIVQYNKCYSAGAFSKSYRLSSKYRNAKIKAIDITKQTYCRKVYNSRSEYLELIFKDNALLRKEFLALTYAKIDYDKAIEFINENYEQHTPEYKSRLVAIDQFNRMHEADFGNGYFTDFTFIENKGRVYTPFTMLSRDVEQFIYFTGFEDERTVTMDMPNSQLCFYDELIERRKVIHIGSVVESRKRVERVRIIKTFGENSPPTLTHSPTPYVYHFSTRWTDYIFNGIGYERMMYLTNWKEKETNHTKEERQEFKAEFFGQLFYNKYSDRLTDMEMIFMANHEETAIQLRELKKKLGNKLLAVEVQRLESLFFHKIIVSHITENYRDIPFIIKHDSVTVPESVADFLTVELNVLVKEFFRCKTIELKLS